MEFEKSRVYTALNADELPIGSKCVFADTVEELKELVYECKGFSKTELREIREGNEVFRFVDKIGHTSALAYLLLPPAEPKYKPFESVEKAMEAIRKHGGWVREKKRNAILLVVKIDNDGIATCDDVAWVNYEVFCEEFVFADDGSPCGELVEE